MILTFDIKEIKETPHGTFITGIFLEKPPYFVSDQKIKLGEYEFEIFGVPKDNLWTLILVTDKVFNEVLEEQVVHLEML
jgi:hypothetical protein